jgi:hypothetical protein
MHTVLRIQKRERFGMRDLRFQFQPLKHGLCQTACPYNRRKLPIVSNEDVTISSQYQPQRKRFGKLSSLIDDDHFEFALTKVRHGARAMSSSRYNPGIIQHTSYGMNRSVNCGKVLGKIFRRVCETRRQFRRIRRPADSQKSNRRIRIEQCQEDFIDSRVGKRAE